MGGFLVLAIVVGLLLLAAPLMAITALIRTGDLRRDITRLNRIVLDLQARLKERPPQGDASPDLQPEQPPTMPEPAAPPATITAEPPAPDLPPPPKAAPPPPPPRLPPAGSGKALEELLVSRWLLILGGIGGFLGAIFLYDYSVEMGWLGPAGQCTLGAVIGLAFIAAGEWARRHPLEKASASLIPPGLTAIGVSALFVSIYAAYALFGLLHPLIAFAALAAVWAATIALSVLHGPFVAALGIFGGFLVPILVSTGSGNAYALFPYLTAVTAAALGILRYKGWGWLAWGTLAGAAAWPLLWFSTPYDVAAPAVGGYLIATAALFVYMPAGLTPHRVAVTPPDFWPTLPPPARLSWAAAAAMLVLALLLVQADDFGFGSIVPAGLLGAFLMITGRRDVTFDALSIGAAAIAVIVLLTWDLPYWPGEIDVLAVLPPGLVPFVTAAAGFALLFGLGGLVLLWGAERPGLWAGISAATPSAVLAIGFGRLNGFDQVDLRWASFGLVLAAINLIAAAWVARRDRKGMVGALAAYAVGVTLAVSLAMTMALENAWLTVALSLQLPALAWIHARTRVCALRTIALIVAGSVLVRLVLNYQLFDYPLGAVPGLNWMLYGYGVPMLAFYAAARMFRRTLDDNLVIALEAGSLVFLTLFLSLEIADIVHGGRFLPGAGFLEASLRSIAWLAVAYALLRQCRAERPRLVAAMGWPILAGLAALQVLLIQVLVKNPLFHSVDVGAWPFLNLLLLGYLAPAVFALAIAAETRRQGVQGMPAFAGATGLGLIFIWLSMEVRRAFHGHYLNFGYTSDAEWWSYSAVWLAYALALLTLGIWRRSPPIRYASLAFLMLAIGKVFLVDMFGVGGLFRVVSVFGLVTSLFLIAWVYRRFVFPPRSTTAPA